MRLMYGIVLACVGVCTGCLYQGVNSVYYVTVETEPLDTNNDGLQDGVTVYLLFRDQNFEIVHFYDADCSVVITVNGYEKEVHFESSEMVGRAGGGIPVVLDIEQGDISIVVVIKGRGEFHTEKKNVKFR
jgi:hypothetical protein